MIPYDKYNVTEFNLENPQSRYICSMCGEITTLHDSISYAGYNLVCNKCRYKIKRVLGIDNEIQLIQGVGKARCMKEEKEDNT